MDVDVDMVNLPTVVHSASVARVRSDGGTGEAAGTRLNTSTMSADATR